MEVIILFGIQLLIFTCFTIIIVFLQRLVMSLSFKAWHFVPPVFFSLFFIYGLLRLNGIVFYGEKDDMTFWGTFDIFIGSLGFLSSIISMIAVYIRRRKRPFIPAVRTRKLLASAAVALYFFMTAVMIYTSCRYGLLC